MKQHTVEQPSLFDTDVPADPPGRLQEPQNAPVSTPTPATPTGAQDEADRTYEALENWLAWRR